MSDDDRCCAINCSAVLVAVNIICIVGLIVATACVSDDTLQSVGIVAGVVVVCTPCVLCILITTRSCCCCCFDVTIPKWAKSAATIVLSGTVAGYAWYTQHRNDAGVCTATCRLNCGALHAVVIIAGVVATVAGIVAIILAWTYMRGDTP